MSKPRVNEEITAPQVLLINEGGKSEGTVSRDQALLLAYERGYDAAEVGPNAHPPVVRLLDFGKYLYEQEKQAKKSKAKTSELKEVRLSFRIGDHDLKIKAERAKKFLEDGDKVRVALPLFGRQMLFRDQAIALLERFRDMAGGMFEEEITQMGNRLLVTMVRPKGKK